MIRIKDKYTRRFFTHKNIWLSWKLQTAYQHLGIRDAYDKFPDFFSYGHFSATGHLIAPGDHHTLQHIQVHFGVDFQADFEDVRWHDVALTWNHTKEHNRSRKLCFHYPGHVPVIRGNPDLHFEGASMSCTAAHLRSHSLNIVSLSDIIEGS